jgi:hypothetical protein
MEISSSPARLRIFPCETGYLCVREKSRLITTTGVNNEDKTNFYLGGIVIPQQNYKEISDVILTRENGSNSEEYHTTVTGSPSENWYCYMLTCTPNYGYINDRNSFEQQLLKIDDSVISRALNDVGLVEFIDQQTDKINIQLLLGLTRQDNISTTKFRQCTEEKERQKTQVVLLLAYYHQLLKYFPSYIDETLSMKLIRCIVPFIDRTLSVQCDTFSNTTVTATTNRFSKNFTTSNVNTITKNRTIIDFGRSPHETVKKYNDSEHLLNTTTTSESLYPDHEKNSPLYYFFEYFMGIPCQLDDPQNILPKKESDDPQKILWSADDIGGVSPLHHNSQMILSNGEPGIHPKNLSNTDDNPQKILPMRGSGISPSDNGTAKLLNDSKLDKKYSALSVIHSGPIRKRKSKKKNKQIQSTIDSGSNFDPLRFKFRLGVVVDFGSNMDAAQKFYKTVSSGTRGRTRWTIIQKRMHQVGLPNYTCFESVLGCQLWFHALRYSSRTRVMELLLLPQEDPKNE